MPSGSQPRLSLPCLQHGEMTAAWQAVREALVELRDSDKDLLERLEESRNCMTRIQTRMDLQEASIREMIDGLEKRLYAHFGDLPERVRSLEAWKGQRSGEIAEQERLKDREPKWWSAKIAAGALVLSALVAAASLALAFFRR